MKSELTFLIFTSFFITGCTNDNVTKEECLNGGFSFKIEKRLNFRTGKYETKTICIKKG